MKTLSMPHCAVYRFCMTASFIATVCIAAGCGNNQNDRFSDEVVHRDNRARDTVMTVRIGVSGMASPRMTYRHYAPLAEYLGKKLQRPAKLVQRSSYEEINRLFTEGMVHIACLAPGAYLHLRGNEAYDIVAVGEPDTAVQHRSIVIVHAGSPVRRFEQLRGKSFAFVDTLSLNGYAVIACMLAKRASEPENFFSDIIISGSHDSAIRMVQRRQVAGTCVSSLILYDMEEEHLIPEKSVRTIYTSEPLPAGPVIIHRDTSEALSTAVREALMSMDTTASGREVLHEMRLRRFVPAQDVNFDRAREIITCCCKQQRSLP